MRNLYAERTPWRVRQPRLLICATAAGLVAGEAKPYTQFMKIKFDMIGLFVRDLSAMVAFYRDVVGIEIDWDGKGPYAEFEHEGIRFAMYERNMLADLLGAEPSFPVGINGTFELALNVGKREVVDSTFKQMTEKGARPVYPPRDEPWKMRSAMITDPEGNLIEIASDFWE